jgi:hypothetical protein
MPSKAQYYYAVGFGSLFYDAFRVTGLYSIDDRSIREYDEWERIG